MRIGVDLGGTKIEAIALGPGGVERARERLATPRDDYDATVVAIVDLVTKVERLAGGTGTVGVGIPGVISPATGLVKNANSTWLNGRPIDGDLIRALGRDVRLANDANCFALSEAADGGGRGADVVFGVILGTGVGGGLVVNGSIVRGANAIGGEWGHNPMPGETPEAMAERPCYCGRAGCLETFLSGPAVAAEFETVTGRAASATEIHDAAESDPAAAAVWGRYVDRLARALGVVINIVDPDVIVLGGGLSKMQGLYDAVPARWDDYVFSDHVVTRLVANAHGDSSGVRGAAWLWPR